MEGSSGKSLSYIIGGSSGMGLATARLLVADGGTVVLVGRDQGKLDARKGELEAGGKGKVEAIAADLYDAEAVKSLIAKIDGETRHINHLVNAAGYFIPRDFFEYTERLRRLHGPQSSPLLHHASRGPEHGEEQERIDRQHRINVGASGNQGDAFLGLFDAKGGSACPD
jgi:NAD(P)-dependent dehydrogenase (short-subunit alcohol dehydrogenase family)